MKKIISHPITRIILGAIVCIGIPMLINKPILKSLFASMGLNDTINGIIRISLASIVLMPLCYVWFYKKVEKRKIAEWDLKYLFRESAFGFGLSVASISFLVLLCAVFIDVDIRYTGFTSKFIFGLFIILSLALVEEIFFRGILYRIIKEKWGMNWALILSGLLFGLVHLANDNMTFQSLISVIAGGLLLGILYSYRERMWLPVSVHYGWNLTQVLLGINLSGTDSFAENAIFKTTMKGPEIITGGIFGIENSIFTIILVFSLFAIYYLLIKRNKVIN
ncbi:MAG: CPBP family intramembrane metalloprotease [Bacteroidales bacterium]|nr:CPBP family intramembrane metalloprotease [Bacteroidales bacterium]